MSNGQVWTDEEIELLLEIFRIEEKVSTLYLTKTFKRTADQIRDKLRNLRKEHQIPDLRTHRAITPPPRKILEKLVKRNALMWIAKDFRVSETTVKKWCVNYGLQTRGPILRDSIEQYPG